MNKNDIAEKYINEMLELLKKHEGKDLHIETYDTSDIIFTSLFKKYNYRLMPINCETDSYYFFIRDEYGKNKKFYDNTVYYEFKLMMDNIDFWIDNNFCEDDEDLDISIHMKDGKVINLVTVRECEDDGELYYKNERIIELLNLLNEYEGKNLNIRFNLNNGQVISDTLFKKFYYNIFPCEEGTIISLESQENHDKVFSIRLNCIEEWEDNNVGNEMKTGIDNNILDLKIYANNNEVNLDTN